MCGWVRAKEDVWWRTSFAANGRIHAFEVIKARLNELVQEVVEPSPEMEEAKIEGSGRAVQNCG